MLFLTLLAAAVAALACVGCSDTDSHRDELLALAIAEDQRNLQKLDIETWLVSESIEVRRRLAYAIGAVGDTANSPYLLKLLADTNVVVRAEAAFAAGQLADTALEASLLNLSVDPDPAVKANALVALSNYDSEKASARLSHLLNDENESESLRALAAESMFRFKDDASFNALIAQAASESPQIKRAVYYSLSRRAKASAQPLFRLGLREKDDEIVISSLRALGRIADSSSVAELEEFLLPEVNWRVQYHALLTSVRLGAKSLLPLIMNLTGTTTNQYVRQQAIQAAGELGDLNTAMQIVEILQDNDDPFQTDALLALAKLSGQTAFPAVQIMAASPNPRHRLASAQACGSLGDFPGAIGILEFLSRDSVAMVRAEAVDLLLQLDSDTLNQRFIPLALADEDIMLVATACNKIVVDTLTSYIQRVFTRYRPDGDPDVKSSLLDCLIEFPIDLPKSDIVTELANRALTDRDYSIRKRGQRLAEKYGVPYELRKPYYESMVTVNNYDSIYTMWQDENPRIAITTARGTIELELYPDVAPKTVYNFLDLCRKGYYNDRVWHRVVPDFVIQDGCSRGDGWGGPGYEIRSEDNPKPYIRGALGMATAGKDTGGSQYFICQSPQPHLNGRYTLFGQVVAGMDIVDQALVGDSITSITILNEPES